MSRRWGRKSSQLTDAEKDAIAERFRAGERLDRIAPDYGISPGQVSNIAIRERACTPRQIRASRKAKEAAMPEPQPEGIETHSVFMGTVIRRNGETMCLTDLWRAAGSPPNRGPYEWLRKEGRDFVEHVSVTLEGRNAAVSTERGGRDSGSTWGNKHIALAYATDLSPALRLHVQEVFFSYVEGRLSADSDETEALLDVTQADAVASTPDIMKLMADMPATIAAAVVAELRGTKRKDLKIDIKRKHLSTVAHFYNGMCPCCHDVQIVTDGERLPGSHFDHWTDNAEKCGARDTWLVCAGCNMGFQSGKLLRDNCRIWFDAFQKRSRQLERQYKLPGIE